MKRLFLLTTIVALVSLGNTVQAGVWDRPLENVYWGDLHIHTQFSVDAYLGGMSGGRYAREAGQYVLYCSKLDFYSVTDHAEMLTKVEYWPEAVSAAHNISEIGASRPDSHGDPSIVAFTGWEWTQQGPYGHKNVILKWDDLKKLPPSPIRCLPGIPGLPEGALEKHGHIKLLNGVTLPDMMKGLRYGRADSTFLAYKPADLYEKLHKYCLDTGVGCQAIVIPHGNAWGAAPTMYTSWDAQLDPKNEDPNIQRLVEVYSKHGNSEEYRDFPPDYRYYRGDVEVSENECSVPVEPSGVQAIVIRQISKQANPSFTERRRFYRAKPGCKKVCQEATTSYVPCCRRAAEIVRERCVNPESEFCKAQMELAMQTVEPFSKGVHGSKKKEIKPEFRKDPGKTDPVEWQTCGQCRDCYQPAYNYIPGGAVQKALASAYFDANGNPHYYRFGFIGSTDTHQAWGGSVKETKHMIEVKTAFASKIGSLNPDTPGWERAVNFLNPGSLAAILSPHRTREDLWENLRARHVYSTSGPRIEVWGRAEVNQRGAPLVMTVGDEATSSANPTFHIKVNGAFAEEQNCPYDDEPMISAHLSRQEFTQVCLNQCYRVTDRRIPLARIEVVKILQPLTPEEAKMKHLQRTKDNPNGLIIDPYYVENISGTAVEWTWTDSEFASEPKGRSVAYYFRIIQQPTEGYNCNPTYLLESGKTCNDYSPSPLDIEKKINPQDGTKPTPLASIPDACYTDVKDPKTYCQERAWTSPFYIVKE